MKTRTPVIATLLAATSSALALTGDTKCSRAMCVSAFVNGTTTVTYELKVSQPNIGWMAVGFGTQMIGVPIVLLYTDASGQTTVSHRLATAHAEPPVDSSPPRTAQGYDALKSLTSDSSTLAFTIPVNSDTNQDIIWAYSATAPSGAGGLREHDDKGTMRLNLLNSLDPTTGTPSGGSSGPGSGSGSGSSDSGMMLTYNQSLVAAHGIMMGVVFFFLLPFGALLARLGRTFWPKWFLAHSTIQGWICGPLVLAGFVLAVVEVGRRGGEHLSTKHKQIGVALFVLYLVQASLGTIIHFFKPTPPPPDWHPARRRTPQNYLHAILGLAILGLGFYQIRTGYRDEWSSTQDVDPVADGVDKFWTAWVVIITVSYVGGLLLLQRQWAQERAWAQQASIANKYGQHVDESSA